MVNNAIFDIQNTKTELRFAPPELLGIIDTQMSFADPAMTRYVPPELEGTPEATQLDPRYAWDGVTHFLHQPKTKPAWFPTGLLNIAVQCCDRMGFEYEVRDLRTPPEEDVPFFFDKIPLWDHQKAAVEAVLQEPTGVVELPPRCYAQGTKMVLADGHTCVVEELSVGAYLGGPDGTRRKVLSVHEGFGPLYKVTPRWGQPFVTNGDHILLLKKYTRRMTRGKNAWGWEELEVQTKDVIAQSPEWKKRTRLYRASNPYPRRRRVVLPIDPYALGVIIGDGSITKGSPEVTSGQPEIIAAIHELASDWGLNCVRRSCPDRAQTWGLSGPGKKQTNPLTDVLRGLGLWGCHSRDKFVPAVYRLAAVDDRLAFLAGLFDCDGHNTGHNSLEWVTSSEQMAQDVEAICWSVGLCFSVVPKRVRGYDHTYWRCTIMGDLTKIPLRVARKKFVEPNQWRDCSMASFTVEPAGEGSFWGFELDKDRRFLMPDGTVSHNSGKTRLMLEVFRRRNQPTIWIAPTSNIVNQTVARALEFFPESDVQRISTKPTKSQQHARLVVTTAAAAVNLPQEFWDTRECLIADECHHVLANNALGKTLQKRAEHIYYRYGMTGTFFRSNGDDLAMRAFLSNVLYSATTKSLEDKGFLAPTYVVFIGVQGPTVRRKLGNMKFHGEGGMGYEGIHTYEPRNDLVADVVGRLHALGKTVLVLVGVKKQGDILKKILEYRVPPAPQGTEFDSVEFISTNRKRGVQEKILSSFVERQEVKVLIGTSLVGEGTDLPNADALVYARGEKASVTYLQGLFRVCTASPGKEFGIVVDFVDTQHRTLLKHSRQRWVIAKGESLFRLSYAESLGDFDQWLGL